MTTPKNTYQRIVPTQGGSSLSVDNPQPVYIGGSQVTAFGSVATTEEYPQVSAYLNSFNDARIWNSYTGSGGTIAVSSESTAMVDLSSTTTIGSYAVLQTAARVPYLPGQGVAYRWTAKFSAGAAGDESLAGPYHAEDGFYVGYLGTDFVFGHRYGRRLEIQRFEITAGTGGAPENLTITLGGNANAVNGVAAGLTARQVAAAIADSGVTFSDGTFTWLPYQVDDYVFFVRQYHGDVTGTMSFASSGSATATVTETQSGANGTQDTVTQANWNIDPLDGTGPSGYTADWTKVNLFELRYGWLGVACPTLFVYNGTTGELIPVHRIQWAGDQTFPTAEDPRFPMAFAAYNAGSTGTHTVSGICCAGLVQGTPSYLGPAWAHDIKVNSIGTTEIPLMSVRTAAVDVARNRINRRRTTIDGVVIANPGTKDATVRLRLGAPSHLTDYEFFSHNSNTNSCVWVDESASAVASNLPLALTVGIPAGETMHIPAPREGAFPIERDQVIIVTGQTDSSTTSLTVSFYGREDG